MKAARKMLTLSLVVFLASNGLSAPPLADKLPEKALFYVGWGGRTLTFDGSLAGQMLKEPEIAALFGAAKKAISSAIGRNKDAAAALEHLWSMGAIAWQHPLALATFDMSARKRPAPRPGARRHVESMFGRAVPVGAVLIDLGKDRPAFAEHLTKLLNLAGDKLKITRAKVGNVSYQTFPTPVGPCALGFVGDLFFASVGQKAPETIVALVGGKAKPLSTEAGFAAAMKQVAGEQVQVAYYLNVSRAYEIVDELTAGDGPATAPAGPSEFRRIVKALGAGDVSAIVGAVNIVDRGMHEKLRILSDAPHLGLLMLLAGKPLPANALDGVPADADMLLTISLDPAKLLAEVKRVAAEIKPRAGLEIEESLGVISEMLGLDIEKDLLAHVGDQWMLVSAPSLGGFLTGTVLTVELKDAAKFGESLSKLEASVSKMLSGPEQAGQEDRPRRRRRGLEIRSCKVGEMQVRYLAMPGRTIPAAPAWAIANGRLYIAAFPQVVVAAATGAAEKPLATDPAFLALRKRVAAAPSALAYANTPALVRKLYGVPMAVWTLLSNVFARQVGPGLSAEMLPALPKVEKYLIAEVCAVSSDAKGITIESYGSGMGRGVVFTSPPVQALTVAALLPPLAKARVLARRALSTGNLKGIGIGCEIYANSHDGQYPPNLISLVEEGIISPKMLMSPNSGREAPRDPQGKPIGPFDYVYLGGRLKSKDVPNPGRIILAYERPEISRYRGTNVLYVDTHVEWVSMERFNRDLRQTQALLEKQRKPGE